MRCSGGDEAFKSLKRSFVDVNHFKSIIKVYSLTTGIQALSYRVEKNKDRNSLFISWSPKKIVGSVSYQFEGESQSIPSILPLNEDDFYEKERVEKVIKLLKDLYQSQGYPDVSVICEELDGAESVVDLKYTITMGEPLIVKDVTVITKSAFVKKIIQQKLDHFHNKPFYAQQVKKELDELKKFFIEQGYFLHRLNLKHVTVGRKVSFYINVTDISVHAYSVKYIGEDDYALNLKSKLKEATILAKRSLNIKRVKEIVLEDTQKNGFLNTSVVVEKKELLNLRNEPFFKTLITINKKKQVKLLNVSFKGNNVISSNKLEKLFYLHSTDQAAANVFDGKYYKDFLNIIREEYIKIGYVNVFLEPPSIEFFSLQSEANLLYRIRERVRAKISNIRVTGLKADLKNKVLGLLQQKIDDAFNPILFKESVTNIKNFLREEGYYFSELTSEKVNKLVLYNRDNTKVDIKFDFNLDKKYSVGEIIIIGNLKTRSKVILRELLFMKGSLLKSSSVVGSQTRILSTGLFGSVNISPVKNSSSDADILISVKEKDYGLIEVAPGVRTDLGPKISTKISYNNIDGLHKQLSLSGQINQRFNLNSLDETRRENEANLLEYIASVNYTENYFLDIPMSFNSSISTSRQRFFSFDANIQKVNYTLSTDLNRWLNLSLTQELETISQYNATNKTDDGEFQIGSITPSLTLDFRNNRINPTKGSFFALSSEFANPTFFSQSNDEIVINYYKLISRNRFYIPFENGVLALSLAGGVQKNLATDKVTDSDGNVRSEGFIPNIKVFRLAGMDNVRGFEDDEINRIVSGEDVSEARVDDTAYMVNLKIEPRIFLSDSTMLGVFYDAGRVFVGDYDTSKLRSSVGLSFKYLTPVGSLDFDYGIKLLRKKDSSGRLESPGRLHVSIGFF
jgi:outer membrane protein insertion porin family